jgi:hypothetical protein
VFAHLSTDITPTNAIGVIDVTSSHSCDLL